MAKDTKIEWCHRRLLDGTIVPGHTFNAWWGCFKISDGCKFCYAEGSAERYGKQIWGPAKSTPRWLLSDAHWQEPYKWNKEAQVSGHRHNVFCGSMSDICEENTNLDAPRQRLFHLAESTPWLNWLFLTKRPENYEKMTPWGSGPWPENIWAMTSIEKQEFAEERLYHLLKIKSVVHGVSAEPLLEIVDFRPWLPALDWIIVGGESGPHLGKKNLAQASESIRSRVFHPDRARTVRDHILEAREAGLTSTKFFFKQHGGVTHATGGRILDERTWDEMPEEFNPHRVLVA